MQSKPDTPTRRVLLFGGTFDPIHNGHLIVARSAAEQLGIARIILIPSAVPPHKSPTTISTAQHRLKMTELAVQTDPMFDVSDCELQRQGPSYTLETLMHFRKTHGPHNELFWLIGADTIKELAIWYRLAELVETCTIVTARRPNSDCDDLSALHGPLTTEQIERLQTHMLDTPLIEISATDIRQRICRNESIRYMVPQPVADYIAEHRLYTHGG